MTGAEFEVAYAARSGVTVDWLRAQGRVVMPCECEQDGCEGWQSINRDAAIEEARRRRPWERHEGFICASCRGWIDPGGRFEQWLPGDVGPGDELTDGAILARVAIYHEHCLPSPALGPGQP